MSKKKITPKANSYPNSCTMLAVSVLTDIPDPAIITAFEKSRCYTKRKGSKILKLKSALNKLGVEYEDHFSDTPLAHQIKQGEKKIYGLRLLESFMPKFRKGNHLVQVCINDWKGPNGTPSFHTIGVSGGHYMNIEIEALDKTFYLGHFTLLGIDGKKWEKLLHDYR